MGEFSGEGDFCSILLACISLALGEIRSSDCTTQTTYFPLCGRVASGGGPSNNDIPPTGLTIPQLTLHGAIQINSPIPDHAPFVCPKAGISFDASNSNLRVKLRYTLPREFSVAIHPTMAVRIRILLLSVSLSLLTPSLRGGKSSIKSTIIIAINQSWSRPLFHLPSLPTVLGSTAGMDPKKAF